MTGSRIAKLVATSLLAAMALLAGCGGGDNDGLDDALGAGEGPSVPGAPDASGADGTGGEPAKGNDGEALVVLTVDGVDYTMTNFLGGECELDDPDPTNDLYVTGYEAKSGGRLSISFDNQQFTGQPKEYSGQVSVGQATQDDGTVSEGRQLQVVSTEPFPFLEGDGTSVSGSLTMKDVADGQTAEVAFDVACE